MIGVFDSGVGGLTVVKEIFKQLPDCQIIYFGDTSRLPYGTKGEDFVKKYSKKITEWLLNNGANVIVIACNTSSAWASDYIKKEFPDTPIFEMINPVVNYVKNNSQHKKIGVIGTPGTIKSNIYAKKLNNFKVFSKACPLFVPLVEEGIINDKISYEITKKYLNDIKKHKIDSLILGCTHYPLLKNTIAKAVGKNIKIINPAYYLAKDIKNFLGKNNHVYKKIKKGSNHKFFSPTNHIILAKYAIYVLKKNPK